MYVRVVIALSFMPIITLFLATMIAEDSELLAWAALVIDFGIAALAATYMYRSYRALIQRVLAVDATREFDLDHVPSLQEALREIATVLKVSLQKVKILLAPCDYSVGASVLTSRGITYIVLPLGFLKLFGGEPAQAKAILAHELAHVAQRDSRLWLLVKAYTQTIRKISIPVAWATGIIGLLVAIGTETATLQSLVQVFSRPAILWAFMYSARTLRHRSERSADLAAAAVVGVDAIQAALERAGNNAEDIAADRDPIGDRRNRIKRLARRYDSPHEAHAA